MEIIHGIGLDIVEVARIEASLNRHGERFRDRVFTAGEQEYCESLSGPARLRSYAARFAAKEAVSKALLVGVGPEFDWRELEVQRDAQGAPRFRAHGRAASYLAKLGVTRVLLSLTHAENYAAAQAVVMRSEVG